MRYALLDLVACQQCHAPLTSFTVREVPSDVPQGIQPGASRVAPGPGVGPVPASMRATPLASLLRTHARAATDPARNFTVDVEEGLLICADCGRWYPIIGQLPEILPDHLRDAERDLTFFRSVAGALPEALRTALEAFAPRRDGADDAGAHHKTAEMTITTKIDDPGFFGPGYTSPFNLWNPEFTLYLIELFGVVMRVLELRKGEVVVDSGSGYAWTTEWLHRAGVPAIGIDISRVYPEIGIARMGANRPHLVIGDVEHLPLQNGVADAILAFESFHHIPDRRRAMAGYDRVLKDGGRILLAEPGATHEHAAVSVEVMDKYGILERGMELDDVAGYAAGTRLNRIEQVFITKVTAADAGATLTVPFLRGRSIVEGHLFTLTRGGALSVLSSVTAPRRRIWPVVKRRIKAALVRMRLD